MFRWIDEHLEEFLLVFLLSAMSLLIGCQVFMRYVMGSSLSWSEELARYLFIWATYIGSAYGVKKNGHVSVIFLIEKFPKNIKNVVNILMYVLFLFFSLLVVKEGFLMTIKIFNLGQSSSSLGIPIGWVYLAPVVGFLLISIRILQELMVSIRALTQEVR